LAKEASGEQKQALAIAVALHRMNIAFDFADLNTFLTSDVFPQIPDGVVPKCIHEARNLFIQPLTEILTNDGLPPVFTDLYKSLHKYLTGIDSVQTALGENLFTLKFEGFNIFDGYLPTFETLQKVAAISKVPENISLIYFSTDFTEGGEQGSFLFSNLTAYGSCYCTEHGKYKNVNLGLISPFGEFVATNLFVNNPTDGFTSPLKSGLVWILNEKPNVEDYAKYDDFNKEKYLADTSATKPTAYFELGFTEQLDQPLDKWTKGNFLFVKLLNAHAEDNIDMNYIGIAGYLDVDAVPSVRDVKYPFLGGSLGVSPQRSLDDLAALGLI